MSENQHYKALFEPLEIHQHTLPNRVIMGSMHTGLEEMRGGFDKLAQYYKERAEGGVGLIVTGGIAPNLAGRVSPLGSQLSFFWQVAKHRKITDAVHSVGGKIAMQILHTGRYAYHPFSVAPSAIKAPITPFKPKALSERGIQKTIRDFVNCAKKAQQAGYDGVEVMGSEGYLINQFIVSKTNKRNDRWGGSFENRIRLAIEIVKSIRRETGDNFIIIFRLSMLDLVEKGSNWEEVVKLGQAIEEAGASIINTGIGWHEARVPTIATSVPRANFVWVTEKIKPHIKIPVVTTNRINTPDVANSIIEQGKSDMVSMARPFLADPDFMKKAKAGQAEKINTCIACNQACLDHIFEHKRVTCLVNPRACYETELNFEKAQNTKKLAVVGAGPAGLSFATYAAERGHQVTLFDAADKIGGQLNVANQIPGKEEFYETIRYFKQRIEDTGVKLELETFVESQQLGSADFDEIVIATGIEPRLPPIDGVEHEKVLNYLDVLKFKKDVGRKVAIVGAGGIGFDVAEYLTHSGDSLTERPGAWANEWKVDLNYENRGGLLAKANIEESPREVYLLQRKTSKLGAGLGKTTGWIHRSSLKNKNVKTLNGVEYVKISDQGLHINVKDKPECLEVDNVIICAGQTPLRKLYDELAAQSKPVHLIGGADVAAELDAKRAIRQGAELAAKI
ncbi:NADPH-dependent 2,4-dienoyl-CoA reductase [Aliikangiella coralliicola]|uniref:NADPH-dependent 2,4-dienoyl-CoA reductase n=1 Tax=Aliikangiella coralliicola TaxID=2592383 RepID=A0A545UD36_9GAMM|nr:NADPH-dependent 2,4-dienoyl-CoA reductase [Aliikangiella coralliicola]TQV87377.1 NADPH-dependent 2,4-dienoyl-CoA reductase [Aliikangiella coralliicola]